jgi:hypothetical protein
MRRFISAVLVSAALAGLFLVAPSIVTPSKASQAQAHGGVTNGCSVPGNPYWRDTPGGNNFHDACDQHDRCYVYHWYGEGETGRSWCDVLLERHGEGVRQDPVVGARTAMELRELERDLLPSCSVARHLVLQPARS